MSNLIYSRPQVLSHQPIQFETTVSGGGGPGGGPGGGGHWPGCFISTACVEAKGLPDDCVELQTLRRFRDTELMTTEDGKSLVYRYYDIAPKILNKINQSSHSKDLYVNLYNDLVLKSVELINSGRAEDAKQNYITIVEQLERKYLKEDLVHSS